MTPCPALLSIPLYDYVLILIWLETTHARQHWRSKANVTYQRVVFARKVL